MGTLRVRFSIYNCDVLGKRKPKAQPRVKPNKIKLKCPICKKPVASAGEDFPFCSNRCRSIDLGKWASGQYVVSSPLVDTEDEFSDQAARGTDSRDDKND